MNDLSTVKGIKNWLRESIEDMKENNNIECPEDIDDHDARIVMDTYEQLLKFIENAEQKVRDKNEKTN